MIFITPDLPIQDPTDFPGIRIDLSILSEDKWLIDTEVKYIINKKKGMWYLTMLFISIENPMKFICREIDKYNSEKKAILYAKILQRGIRKDARGILKTNPNGFNFCKN